MTEHEIEKLKARAARSAADAPLIGEKTTAWLQRQIRIELAEEQQRPTAA